MTNIENQIYYKVYDGFDSQIQIQLNVFDKQIKDEIWDQVKVQLTYKIWSQIRNKIGEPIKELLSKKSYD